jgi:[protein-PII] uridylyltransferase
MSLSSLVTQRREKLESEKAKLAERYWNNEAVETLVSDLAEVMDKLILDAWHEQITQSKDIALFAVGGYGRRELHPGSDIDLLVVAKDPKSHGRAIELFLQNVFDLNIEVGHSVRDITTCIKECEADITVATAMFERRLLGGDAALDTSVDEALSKKKVWPAEKFFAAKYQEQIERHKQFDDVDYNLEPNVKASPGGMRDIHTALWICNRNFGTTDISRLVEMNVLTAEEGKWLIEGRRFLWWVRFGLHLIAGRKEDQLHFSRQRELAQRLGFVDTDSQMGVEVFMYHFYRHILALTEVNGILLKHFQETVESAKREKITQINERFRLVNHRIEAVHDNVFKDSPSALLEMFVLMAQREEDIQVRVSTIRLMRESLALIDDDFRKNPDNTRLFLNLLKAPYTVVTQLIRMRKYGVLGRYLPEFKQIIGQMQHDLFHIYTVDAHTMMVVRNMRKFRYEWAKETFPIAHYCSNTIPKLELLYIAGLFHDIGKGRGGDHSTLGSIDARKFCQLHGLNQADTDLVCWLVERHLYMSSVSQNQDIYDPEVIQAFAQDVKSEMRLNYLYALTVADINATNPNLWNSWRASLMRHLYSETRKTLRHGSGDAMDRDETIAAYQESALERLQNTFSEERVRTLWQNLGDDFFLRHGTDEISDISRALLEHDHQQGPFVSMSPADLTYLGEGATQIYIWAEDKPKTFAATLVCLTQWDLSVVDAHINKAVNGRIFNTFTILTAYGVPLEQEKKLRCEFFEKVNATLVAPSPRTDGATRRVPRQLRELPWPTEVAMATDDEGLTTTVNILAADRPGLLANISLLLIDLELELSSARITTLGERVEDVFVVTDADGQAITDKAQLYNLENALRQKLDACMGLGGSGGLGENTLSSVNGAKV